MGGWIDRKMDGVDGQVVGWTDRWVGRWANG